HAGTLITPLGRAWAALSPVSVGRRSSGLFGALSPQFQTNTNRGSSPSLTGLCRTTSATRNLERQLPSPFIVDENIALRTVREAPTSRDSWSSRPIPIFARQRNIF